MIRLRNCRRRRKQRSVIERLASKLWLPKLWLPMSPGYPCCCEEECVCEACLDNDYPPSLDVDIDGVVNSGNPCAEADCADYDGTWNVGKYDTCIVTGNNCFEHRIIYSETFAGVDVCGADIYMQVNIWWKYFNDATRRITVILRSGGAAGVDFILSESVQSDPYDCAGFSALDIPYLTNATYCDGSAATCKLTAAA